MSGGLRKLCIQLCLLLLLAAGWFGSLQSVRQLGEIPSTVQLRYHTKRFSPKELETVVESEASQSEEALPLTAFGQLDSAKVSVHEPGREADITLLWTFGRMDRAAAAPLLSGYYPAAGETGCVVDETAAYRLWGSREVLGESLRYDKTDYTVRGVTKSMGGVLLLPASAKEEVLSSLVLEPPPGKDRRAAAEAFLVRHSLDEPDAVLLLGGAAFLSRLLLFLPFLILAAALLFQLLRELWQLRHTPFLFLIYLCALLLILCGAFWLCGVKLSFPQSMVPTRWSDFEFWQRLFSGWGESLGELLRSGKLIPDLIFWKAWGKAVGCSIFASLWAILFLIVRKRI